MERLAVSLHVVDRACAFQVQLLLRLATAAVMVNALVQKLQVTVPSTLALPQFLLRFLSQFLLRFLSQFLCLPPSHVRLPTQDVLQVVSAAVASAEVTDVALRLLIKKFMEGNQC